ncbi:MAG: MFS transporter [Armatimonadetes bacterium]|nr:MFS transporter [Armatimonadota bacterium]
MTSPSVYWRLSVMMFLQYATLGAWSPVLAVYLQEQLGFSGAKTGSIYSLLWLGCILSPLLGGQLADRWLSTERVLAVLHFAGALCLWKSSQATSFANLWLWMLLFAVAFAPTLALSNSISFRHLADTRRQFGSVRVFGTIGWICAGLLLSAWRKGYLGIRPWPSQSDALVLGACAEAGLAAWCFLLPHTPPACSGESPWAFLRVWAIAQDKRFLSFLYIAFIISTQLHFYYVLGGPFLRDLGVSTIHLPGTMAIAQTAEILVMALGLRIALSRIGFRWTLLLGLMAWALRYLVWATVAWMAWPAWVAVASLALHGFCTVFWFVAGQVYVDQVAPPGVRHSAQALLTFATMGIGYYLGTHLAGIVQDLFSHPKLDALGRVLLDAAGRPQYVTEWGAVFLVPVLVGLLCTTVHAAVFQELPGVGEVRQHAVPKAKAT